MGTRGRRLGLGGFTLVELLVVIAIIAILAALLIAVLGRVQAQARRANCASQQKQIYAAARLYANNFKDNLPDLFNGATFDQHAKIYRNSHWCRNEPSGTEKVPAGLWLLYVGKHAESIEVFYCPNIRGGRNYGGSENELVDDIPKMVGYFYNHFPDQVPVGQGNIPPPAGAELEECSNCLGIPRPNVFYALFADVFYDSMQQPHRDAGGLNVCYWDGKVDWIGLSRQRIPWNAHSGESEIFSDDVAGSIMVVRAWALLSGLRR